MAQPPELSRIRQDSLAQLCRHFEWSEKVSGFITPNATVQTVLTSLLNHKYWFDAASLLAHALPKREAVWWSMLVVSDYLPLSATATLPLEEATLNAVRQWLAKPEEPQRMAAHDAGLKAGNRLPAYWCAMGAFWSNGNITPNVGVVTPPPPFLYARAVAACIDMAASLCGTEREARYEKWLKTGHLIAAGKNPVAQGNALA